MYYENSNQQNGEMAVLISEKIDFRIQLLIDTKTFQIKMLIHQEHRTIINIYAPKYKL